MCSYSSEVKYYKSYFIICSQKVYCLFHMSLYKSQVTHPTHLCIYIYKICLFYSFLFCRKSLPTISYLEYSILRQVRQTPQVRVRKKCQQQCEKDIENNPLCPIFNDSSLWHFLFLKLWQLAPASSSFCLFSIAFILYPSIYLLSIYLGLTSVPSLSLCLPRCSNCFPTSLSGDV